MRRALSLAETIVALFILTAGSLACVGLLLSALRYQAQSLESVTASQLSGIVLGRIREYARGSANFDSWTAYDNDSYQHPDFPAYTVNVSSSVQQACYSPSSSLELARPEGQRRLERSLRIVQVEVVWNRRSHSLVAQVYGPARPVRAILPVTVTSASSSSLARDAQMTLEGHLFDSTGSEIVGVPFYWSLASAPPSGMGTLETGLDLTEKTVRLFHCFYAGDPASTPRQYLPGTVVVSCRARYQGVDYAGNSTEVTLDP